MNRIHRIILLIGIAALFIGCAAPEKAVKKPLADSTIKLPALFCDNMILQQNTNAPVWGKAAPGAKISVSIGKRTAKTVADKNGKWLARLKTPKAGGPYTLTLSDGGKPVILKNVAVGEVWVCSGQSNMQWTVRSSNDAEEETKNANYPNIRLFSVKRKTSQNPLDDVGGKWTSCSPTSVLHFSAVGYFFGRHLHKNLNVPVGLINSSWGGTRAEAWTSTEMLKSDKELSPIVTAWDKWFAEDYAAACKKYEEKIAGHKLRLAQWKKDKAEGKKVTKTAPRRPRHPYGPTSQHHPANLYNAMIAPLIPYAIQGAIWYQGESNAGRSYQYRKLFKAMITDWRNRWGRGDFPFLTVQLANFRSRSDKPTASAWAELREAQLMSLELPNTGLAVIIDIGAANDIHPRNKQDVGKRLALWALGNTYDKNIVFSGPLYSGMQKEGSKIRVRFKHTGSGLVARGDKLAAFSIAGKDMKFVWADTKIDGNTVLVWSDKIKNPAAVRYGWQNNPPCNLYNKEGLPASPFRTDSWPGVTDKKHKPYM